MKGRYHTRQQELVYSCMQQHTGEFFSVDELTHILAERESIGRSTVYRALERLSSDGVLIRVPATEGGSVRYGFVEQTPDAKLVCTRCNTIVPLSCKSLEAFRAHVRARHGFALDMQQSVFFGLCAACIAQSSSENMLGVNHA